MWAAKQAEARARAMYEYHRAMAAQQQAPVGAEDFIYVDGVWQQQPAPGLIEALDR